MQRILITSLSVHWTVVFAFAAFQAAGMHPQETAIAAMLAVAYALAATLFLWLALTAWGRGAGEVDAVAGLALAMAALALAAGLILDWMAGGAPPLMLAATQVAALGVTHLVIRAGEPSAVTADGTRGLSGAFARRLALSAAHGSMLTRLSRRDTPGDTQD